MFSRLLKAGLLWPTLLSALALATLVSLGTWQMQRKAWKDGVQAAIAERSKAAPENVETAVKAHSDPAALAYRRVTARGRFLNDYERYIYAPHPRLGPGYHVVTPFETEGGKALILVNRGYVTDALKDPAKRTAGQIEGTTAVTGLLRPPAPKGAFDPVPDAKALIWYATDAQSILDSIPATVAPAAVRAAGGPAILLDAEAEPANPGGWPKGGTTLVKLTNRHFEYAITWYGLAATLIAVYGAFAWGRLKSRAAALD